MSDTSTEVERMSDDDLLLQINRFDPYDVEFARRFRALAAERDENWQKYVDANEARIDADAALAEMGAVRVKPLVWEDYPINGEPVLSMAVTPNGTYFICDDTDDFTGRYCEFVSHKDATWYGTANPSTTLICDHQHVDDPETLKAAAQVDYETRILAAIEPAPSVREAARVLLGLLDTKTEIAPISAAAIEAAWQATFKERGFSAVRGFLRAIAERKE